MGNLAERSTLDSFEIPDVSLYVDENEDSFHAVSDVR